MTKAEMIQHLRMAACNENTVTGMANAFDLGAEHERDVIEQARKYQQRGQ